MNMNPLKAWRHVMIIIAITALVIIVGLMIYAIPGRLDDQARGQMAMIDAHKADLKANWNKDGER